MSALVDLQNAQAAIATAVSTAVADIQSLADKVASLGDAVSSADAETVATALNTLAGNLNAAVNPPAPPAAV